MKKKKIGIKIITANVEMVNKSVKNHTMIMEETLTAYVIIMESHGYKNIQSEKLWKRSLGTVEKF